MPDRPSLRQNGSSNAIWILITHPAGQFWMR